MCRFICLGFLLFAAAPVLAQAAPSAADSTERGRGLDRILDVLLAPDGAGKERTLVLLIDSTASLGTASFATEIESALARNRNRLAGTKIGIARVGAAGQIAVPPTEDAKVIAAGAKRVLEAPEKSFKNVYSDVRRLAGSLGGKSGSREIVLVTLENGDAEDDVEATVAALGRAGVKLSVIAREAFLADSYWVSRATRPPRGLGLFGADAAFIDLPWGWIFQQTVANQAVSSGFAMYGLSRLAASSGGKVFLFYPPSGDGHRCAPYGCLLCSGDHIPVGESYQNHRLRALAPSIEPRNRARQAAAGDPYYQAVLRAWSRASKAGIVRSRPSIRAGGAPEKRLVGRGADLGGSLSFSSQASRADKLARTCGQIASDLEAEIARAEDGDGSQRYKVIAELTRVMLRVTRVNLLGFAAFCREAGPQLVDRSGNDILPPEVPMFGEEQRPTGIGSMNLPFCHGMKPFAEVRLPGGEAMEREIAELAPLVDGFLARHEHTPFGKALRVYGLARFHFTVRGKYTPPPDRKVPTSPTDQTATDRPTRADSPATVGERRRAGAGKLKLVAAIALTLALAAPAAGQDDLGKLIADLGGQDSTKRSAALTRLRERKDPRAIPLLLEALPGFPMMGRYYGVLVLDTYPKDLSERAFRTLAGSADPYLRLCAGSALYQFGEKKAVSLIVKALRADGVDADTRYWMLNRLYAVRDPRVQESVRALLVPEADLRVLGQAIYLLSNQADEEAAPACRALLADTRAGARALAAALLFRFGEEERSADLAKAIRTGEVGSSEFSRVVTIFTTAGRATEEILDAVTELIAAKENTGILQQAIRLVARYRHRKAVPALEKLLDHKTAYIAKAAFEALVELSGALNVETLLPLLDSDDPERRLMAANALRRMDDFTGLEVVLEILGGSEVVPKREAARVIGGFRVGVAVLPLIDALSDPDQTVRMYAATSLRSTLSTLYPLRRFDLAAAGYSYNGAEAARKAAAERIRAWWSENREKDW